VSDRGRRDATARRPLPVLLPEWPTGWRARLLWDRRFLVLEYFALCGAMTAAWSAVIERFHLPEWAPTAPYNLPWVIGMVVVFRVRAGTARRWHRADELAGRSSTRAARPGCSVEDAWALLRSWRYRRLPGQFYVQPAVGAGSLLVVEGGAVAWGVHGGVGAAVAVLVTAAVAGLAVLPVRSVRRSRQALGQLVARDVEPVPARVLGWDPQTRHCVVELSGTDRRTAVPVPLDHPLRRLVRGDEVWLFGDLDAVEAASSGREAPPAMVALVAPGSVVHSREAFDWPAVDRPATARTPAARAGADTKLPGVLTRADVERRGRR
jgi:hypothetical protein